MLKKLLGLNIFSRKVQYLDRSETIKDIRKVFPKKDINVGMTIEEIMFEAGRQDVIDYVTRRLR